jgi:hypothetical protein
MSGFLLAVLLLLQAPAKGTIRGSVVAADNGAPVAGVSVFAMPPVGATSPGIEPVMTTTDVQGRFELAVAPGSYVVAVDDTEAAGFARQAYGAAQSGLTGMLSASPIAVAAGQSQQGIIIRLVRSGSISGRILGARGEPFVDGEIRVRRVIYDPSGRRMLSGERMPFPVNDRGEFRVFGVDPGMVYLTAGPQFGREVGRYADLTYYPREADVSTAKPIDFKPGANVTNIDIQLLPRPPVHVIRGRVVDARTGQPPTQRALFWLLPRDREVGSLRAPSVRYGEGGSFEISDVAEGQYWISARLGDTMPLFAAQRIDIRDGDVAGLVMAFARNVSVSGRVRAEVPLGSSLRVQLDTVRNNAYQMNMANAVAPVPVGADGTFTVSELPPGEYLVKLTGLPDGTYAKEARIEAVDALNEPVTIGSTTPARLEIALGSARGQIEGRLINAEQQPVAKAEVVLVPDKLRARPDFYKTAMTDASGRFVIRGIVAGDYKVFAWETLQAYRYFDPGFVAQFENQGEPVRVTEEASKNVTVRQIR